MYCFTNTSIHTAFSSTASASRCHSALLADSSQLTANSWQLTADSFYLLTVFPTTDTDPSHSFRMTINISLIMTPCRPVSFWTVARMPCGKNGKRNNESEWRIYVSDDVLPLFLITVIDPSHSLRITINVSLIMKPYRLRSFWTEARTSCGKDGKRNDETEWRIYYPDGVLPASSPR